MLAFFVLLLGSMSLTNYLERVAPAYSRMRHSPQHAFVRFAYATFRTELWQQFQAIPTAVTFTTSDPYANASELFAAMETGVLAVYTADGVPDSHPLARTAPNGETFNSIFRAVHDALAHYPERNDFTVVGEYRAYLAHARLLSPIAIAALFTETVGQQSILRTTGHYAEQKAGILPFYLRNLGTERLLA